MKKDEIVTNGIFRFRQIPKNQNELLSAIENLEKKFPGFKFVNPTQKVDFLPEDTQYYFLIDTLNKQVHNVFVKFDTAIISDFKFVKCSSFSDEQIFQKKKALEALYPDFEFVTPEIAVAQLPEDERKKMSKYHMVDLEKSIGLCEYAFVIDTLHKKIYYTNLPFFDV